MQRRSRQRGWLAALALLVAAALLLWLTGIGAQAWQAGQDLETGLVKRWLRAEGDRVAKGEAIVEIETEKITLEVEAPAAGVLLKVIAPDGAEVPILSPIGVIGEPGEDVSGIS